MKNNPDSTTTFLRLLGGTLLAGLVAFQAAPAARAATLNYHVDVNTASLVGNSAGPFSLDLQLGRGDGLANTVTLGSFVFTGGTPTGTGTATGGASGGLGGSVTLADTGNINEFYQTFSANVTAVGFDVSTTLNPSAGTPDLFTVSILDNQLFPIPTTSPGAGTTAETDYLVGMPIDDRTTFSSVRTFTSNVSGSPTMGVTVSAVPEPSSAAWLGAALAGLGAWTALRRRRMVG